MPWPFLPEQTIRHIVQMPPLLALRIPSSTGANDMQMGVVLAVAAMGLDNHDIAPFERLATETAPDIIQAPDSTAYERTQDVFGVLIKCLSQHRGHGQDDMAIDDALMQHRTDLAHPIVDVDFCASEAQRRFTAHRDSMGAFPTLQTAVLNIAHRVGIAAPEHLLHEASIVARLVTRVDAGEAVPVLGKDLFEDAPRRRRCCSHQAVSLRGVELCVVALFYHIWPTTSTPLSALTRAHSHTSLTLEPRGLQGNPQMEIPTSHSLYQLFIF